MTPECDFALAPTTRDDQRAPSVLDNVDITSERMPLPEAAALMLGELCKGLRSDSKEPLARAVESGVPETVFQKDDPGLISGGLQQSDQPVSTGRAAAIPDQQRQNSSRLRVGAIAVTLILLTLAATVFLFRSPSPSPSPTMTPVADQTSNLPTPPEPILVKQQPAEPKSAAGTTLPSPTIPPVSDQTSKLRPPPKPKLVKRQPAKPKFAAATTPTDSAVARKTGPDTPPSVKAVPAKSWNDALNADLKACGDKSLFSRIVCTETARWKHCPGHWGTIDDCPSNMAGQKAP